MSNVIALPNNGLAPSNADIARHLREQADWLEEADASPMNAAIVLYEYENGDMVRNTCGKPIDRARVIGLLLTSIHHALHGHQGNEDE